MLTGITTYIAEFVLISNLSLVNAIYNACPCRHGDEVMLNKSGGWLTRSKPASSNEGGVIIQTGAVDSVDLVPTNHFLDMLSKGN